MPAPAPKERPPADLLLAALSALLVTAVVTGACLGVAGQEWAWIVAPVSFPLMVLSVGLHELGHALAARAFGWPILWVDLGAGRLLRTVPVGGIEIRLRVVPIGGRVAVAPTRRDGMGLRLWLFTAAGPLTNLLLVILLVKGVPRPDSWSSVWGVLLGAAIVANAWLFVGNLLPIRRAYESNVSDGYALITLPFRRRRVLDDTFLGSRNALGEQLLARGDVAGARAVFEALRRSRPDHVLPRVGLATCLTLDGDHTRALEVVVGLTRRSDLPANYDAFVQNIAAWCRLRTNDEAHFTEHVDRLRRGLALGSVIPDAARLAMQDTLGELLVRIGRVEEGVPLLQAVLDNPAATARVKAFTACALCRAARARGEDGAIWLERARGYDAANPVIAEIERESPVDVALVDLRLSGEALTGSTP